MNTKTSGRAWHGVLLLGIAFILACPTGPAVAAEPVGVVLQAVGQVEIQGPAQAGWQPVALKQEVFADNVLRTGSGARVKVLLNDDTLVSLGEESEVAIAEFVTVPERGLRKVTMKLTRGVSRFIVGGSFPNPDSRIEVHTSTAVMGIRGTTFYVLISSPGKTFIVATVDAVAVRNILASVAGSVVLEPNFATTVLEGLPPEAPRLVTMGELKELIKATSTPSHWASGVGLTKQLAKAAVILLTGELASPDVISSPESDTIVSDISQEVQDDIIKTGGLPPGLAKRGELPPGLGRKDQLPSGINKSLSSPDP